MAEITATAPGKIILFGEHAVVYGQPAIAVPLAVVQSRAVVRPGRAGEGLIIVTANLGRTFVVRAEAQPDDPALVVAARLLLTHLRKPVPDLQVVLHSTIPVASGLGSGAAVTTALLRALSAALGQPLDNVTLNALVYEVEKLYHGTPSGIDNTVVVYGLPVYFVRGQPIETFTIGAPVHLLVADTGLASPTHVAVGDVRMLRDADPARIDAVLEAIGTVVRSARAAIEQGDTPALGRLARENQALLRELTVSSEALETLITAAEAAGAEGAKLSGAGRGGNLIAFVRAEMAPAVMTALKAAGAVRVLYTVLT
ncbi:MAG: mevalonate kinase [Anaerolineae bacterium]|nr:mevalonate kinase [Anaerolineae bacterium]